jgi:hypothetical protein
MDRQTDVIDGWVNIHTDMYRQMVEQTERRAYEWTNIQRIAGQPYR